MDAKRFLASAHAQYTKRDIVDRLHEASAWGVPDNESMGLSHSEFASLCGEAAREIQRLRERIRQEFE